VLDYRILKVEIGRSFAAVYGFLADGRNFSAWGGGDPGTTVEHLGGNDWLVQMDARKLVLRYSKRNALGIMDTEIILHGETAGWMRPIRLYPNRSGSELLLIQFRRPGATEEQYASEAEWINSDLLRIKSFLEKGRPEETMLRSRVISLAIERPVRDTYRLLSDPANFPKWASLTGHRFEHQGGRDWLADTAAGPRVVRFCEPNDLGVLDHAVFGEGEEPIVGPMRVVANEEGTILHYTFFQRPGLSDEKFDSTIEWITTDLMTAKSLLEL
jgi:hypothetical protein